MLNQSLASLEGLRIDAFETSFLRSVRLDPPPQFVLGKRVVYLVGKFFPPDWGSERPQINSAETKKCSIASYLGADCRLIGCNDHPRTPKFKKDRGFERDNLTIIPSFNLGKRLRIVTTTFAYLGWLLKNRHTFDVIATYNAGVHLALPALVLKWFFGKPVIVDFEDDYLSRKGHLSSSIGQRVLLHYADGAIVANEKMIQYLSDIPVSVVNAFVDLSFVSDSLLSKPRDLIRLIYSGSFDEIRGADLIEELLKQLDLQDVKYRLDMTGFGPLGHIGKRLHNGENIIFHGFLDSDDLASLIKRADVGLVLQKPTHPFSQGSFPSKVMTYARQGVPSLILRNYDPSKFRAGPT